MPTVKTEPKRLSELVLFELDQRYCRTAIEIDTAGTYVIGQVLADVEADVVADAPQPAFDDVICLENFEIEEGDSKVVAVLVRGPAIVNFDAIEREAGTDESDEELTTRLANLITQGISFVREPEETTEGVS